jgi:hypothetical protein
MTRTLMRGGKETVWKSEGQLAAIVVHHVAASWSSDGFGA